MQRIRKKQIIHQIRLPLQYMGVIINPNAPFDMLNGVIFQIIRTIFCYKDKFPIMCKTVNIILYPICTIIWNIAMHTEICSDRNTQIIVSFCYILNLTLFPSIGKALESDLGFHAVFCHFTPP